MISVVRTQTKASSLYYPSVGPQRSELSLVSHEKRLSCLPACLLSLIIRSFLIVVKFIHDFGFISKEFSNEIWPMAVETKDQNRFFSLLTFDSKGVLKSSLGSHSQRATDTKKQPSTIICSLESRPKTKRKSKAGATGVGVGPLIRNSFWAIGKQLSWPLKKMSFD